MRSPLPSSITTKFAKYVPKPLGKFACRNVSESTIARTTSSKSDIHSRNFSSGCSGTAVSKNFSSMAPKFDVEEDIDIENSTRLTTTTRDHINVRMHETKAKASAENSSMKSMPRLEKLRKKLSSQDDKNIHIDSIKSFGDGSSKRSKRGNKKEPAPLKTSLISWREILERAKEEYAIEDDNSQPSSKRTEQESLMLTDSFSRKHTYLRISLGERCNLRCLYCMPPEGVPLQSQDKLINADEVDRLVRLFTAGGVDKVRLTGGEPLLRKDLPQIISSIASQPEITSVGITTNGITLSRHLQTLVDSGLTHANISLDTLNESKFEEITRRKGLTKVLKAIEDTCAVLPKGHVKINCVVMKGFNDDELRDFVNISKDLPVDVRFIEWMPFNDNGWNKDRFLSYDSMMNRIISDGVSEIQPEPYVSSLKGLGPIELERLVDGDNDTTKWWQAADHEGRLGFITSMTEHFCGTCNRMRITADGQLKVCLFGSSEVSLRDAMREGASDEDLGLIVRAALHKKKFALGGHGNAEGIKKANNNRPMTLIGG